MMTKKMQFSSVLEKIRKMDVSNYIKLIKSNDAGSNLLPYLRKLLKCPVSVMTTNPATVQLSTYLTSKHSHTPVQRASVTCIKALLVLVWDQPRNLT